MLTFTGSMTTILDTVPTAKYFSLDRSRKYNSEAKDMFTDGISRRQLNFEKVAKALAIFWIILSLAEASVTYVCLQNSANIEGNPFGRMLLSHNEILFYAAKLLVTAAVGWGFWWLATKTTHLKLMIACQIFLVAMFTSVFINNLLHL